MKISSSYFSVAALAVASGFLGGILPKAHADVAEASDKAYAMASKYSAMNYYMTPVREGHGGFGVTLEFEVPVNRGLDYVFIAAGDHYCEEIHLYVESEESQNNLVRDRRHNGGGLAGVRWRSDYNGTVTVVVHFARVSDRCGWSAVIGRRGTPTSPFDSSSAISTTPGSSEHLAGPPAPGDTNATH